MTTNARIEQGDWLTLQVKVTTAQSDGRVTVEHMTGQKVTMDSDSPEIVGIVKRRKEPSPPAERDQTEAIAAVTGEAPPNYATSRRYSISDWP